MNTEAVKPNVKVRPKPVGQRLSGIRGQMEQAGLLDEFIRLCTPSQPTRVMCAWIKERLGVTVELPALIAVRAQLGCRAAVGGKRGTSGAVRVLRVARRAQ